MKKLTAFLSGYVAIIGLAFNVPAQQPTKDDSVLPEGPLLVKLPRDAQCIISFHNISAKAGADGQPAKPAIFQRQTLIRSGDVDFSEVVSFADKRTRKTWTTGGYSVLIDSMGDGPIASAATGDAGPQFPGMEIVSRGNFTGVISMGGRKCIAFRSVNPETEMESDAYVDLKTRLPVSGKIGEVSFIYEFSAVPAGSVVVPPEAQKEIAYLQRMYKEAALRPR